VVEADHAARGIEHLFGVRRPREQVSAFSAP